MNIEARARREQLEICPESLIRNAIDLQVQLLFRRHYLVIFFHRSLLLTNASQMKRKLGVTMRILPPGFSTRTHSLIVALISRHGVQSLIEILAIAMNLA